MIRQCVVELWPMGIISGQSVQQSTRIRNCCSHRYSNQLQFAEKDEVVLASVLVALWDERLSGLDTAGKTT